MASTIDVLQNYNEMFAHRYSSEDEEYQKYVKRPGDAPPIVEEWLNRGPSMSSVSEIIQSFENKYAHRFTSKDEEYQKYIQRPADLPPLIEDWRTRSGGGQRYRDRFRDNRQFRGRGDRYDCQGRYRSSSWHERDWGNSYQQQRRGQPSSSQHGWFPQYGYHPYSQRPPYDRY
uniref:RNMT-activating mini protein n=1 Tax=Salvator merianae TaxID=96440 RepID=A0A8D0BG13_SALMN